MNSTFQPGQLNVLKRDNSSVSYDDDKIKAALSKAFLDSEGDNALDSSRVRELIETLVSQVTATLNRRMPSGGSVHIEEIQDQVELALMRSSQHKVAREYVLYREKQAQARESIMAAGASKSNIHITQPNGGKTLLNLEAYGLRVQLACTGLNRVDPSIIISSSLDTLYEGVDEKNVYLNLVTTTRALIENEPEYSFVAARLLNTILKEEVASHYQSKGFYSFSDDKSYRVCYEHYLKLGVEKGLLSPDLISKFDLEQIVEAIDPSADQQFKYLGLQTLYDRYLIHIDNVRIELPQWFFMRVAMGVAVNEDNPTSSAIAFYRLLSSFDYMCSTPTLFNSGTLRPQLSSCYLTTVPDDLHGIYGAMQDNAMLSKWAGGLGNDWTPVRALGSYIKGTNGKSQGVVPFLKVANDTAVAVNQGGKRKGAMCAYLETWHLDIEEFLELRKNTGDDRRRTHDMNTANWVPDLFMKRVFEDKEWTLFTPSETPDLHDLYGKAFEERYENYERMADAGEIKTYKRVSASGLWRKMLGMLFETGHPWVTFKDSCNLRSPQQHAGVIHSSNLCTEITLNTSADDEIAVCNLGSINLAQHIEDGKLNQQKLKRTITVAVRLLDNVIDVNYYPVKAAETANKRHRPIGLGMMGFQDALYQMRIPYGSQEAIDFADESMELFSYFAIKASCQLAKEKGRYSSFEGSLWSQGILPIDSIALLQESRGDDYLKMDTSVQLDWDLVRTEVAKLGMRNSNVMAIAPTATIANITGVSQSIEPTYQNLYVKSNLSGEFTVVNPHLVADLQALDLWDELMVSDLKYYDGSVANIDRVPENLKALYATAFEVEPKWIVDAASRRQKWLDQAQSLNLYIDGASGRKLDITYRMAWLSGLKTTYYLRALAATSTEKSTINTGQLNAVQSAPVPKACSLDDPDCEACQ